MGQPSVSSVVLHQEAGISEVRAATSYFLAESPRGALAVEPLLPWIEPSEGVGERGAREKF